MLPANGPHAMSLSQYSINDTITIPVNVEALACEFADCGAYLVANSILFFLGFTKHCTALFVLVDARCATNRNYVQLQNKR